MLNTLSMPGREAIEAASFWSRSHCLASARRVFASTFSSNSHTESANFSQLLGQRYFAFQPHGVEVIHCQLLGRCFQTTPNHTDWDQEDDQVTYIGFCSSTNLLQMSTTIPMVINSRCISFCSSHGELNGEVIIHWTNASLSHVWETHWRATSHAP